MAALSNSIGPADANGVECRVVQRGEIESALRLILASPTGLGADSQVLDFLSFCVERSIDTNATWIATHNGRIVWSMLPVVSAGNTMLIFTPTVVFQQTPPASIGMLGEELCGHYRMRGVQLAQMLIDPAHRPVIDAYRNAGFDELAELVYLQRSVRSRKIPAPTLPAGFSLKNYAHETHSHFVDVIQRSYVQSQDCPALNGMRDMSDVIAGHQATGDFDPSLWWVLHERDRAVAVLLLARLPQGQTIELVYLGLAPEVRGRGVGDLLVTHSLAIASAEDRETLTLAVDSRNQPALRLYYRHGMSRIGSRVAMLRDLRTSKGTGVRAQGSANVNAPATARDGISLSSLSPEP